MSQAKLYVGTKIIQARPMDEQDFYRVHKPSRWTAETGKRDGYCVEYPDGYISWSPKDTFETAYREVTDAEKELF